MKAVHIYKLLMIRMITSSRSLWTLGIVLVYTYAFSFPILQLSQKLNITVSPFIMAFLINDQASHIVLLSGLLFALIVLDFQKELRQPLLMRSGYISYAVGYLLYLITIIILYEFIAILLSQLWILPVTNWQNDWGTGWRIICSDAVLYKYHITFIPNIHLMENYSAIEATAISIGFECLLMILLALLSCTMNTITRSISGSLVSMTIILSDMILYNMFPISFRKYSPVTLAMLSSYMEAEKRHGMTHIYAASYYAISLVVLIVSYFLVYSLWLKRNKGGMLV